MTFDIDVGGRQRRVSIEPAGDANGQGGRFRVSIDDAAWVVDGRRTDLGWSIVYADGGRSVDAAVTEQAKGAVLVQLPRADVRLAVDGRRFRGVAADGPSAGDAGVSAPMPGRVVRVLVKPGDEVRARQGLVVVEAMKMENELAAPRAGRVAEVLVAEGQPVDAGRLLVRLETGFLET